MTVTDSAERLEKIFWWVVGKIPAWKGAHIEDWTEKKTPSRSPKENCLGVDVDMVVVG